MAVMRVLAKVEKEIKFESYLRSNEGMATISDSHSKPKLLATKRKGKKRTSSNQHFK